MSIDTTGPDQSDKPSQAEGEDPDRPSEVHEVIPAEGKPSQADG